MSDVGPLYRRDDDDCDVITYTLSSSSDWGLAQSTHQRPVHRLFRAREDAIIVKTSERAVDDVAESNNSQYLKKRYNEEIIM